MLIQLLFGWKTAFSGDGRKATARACQFRLNRIFGAGIASIWESLNKTRSVLTLDGRGRYYCPFVPES